VTPTSAGARTPTAAASHPTLRKSFRKTLKTVSGFRVRMRTVFVPYVLLHPHSRSHFHAHINGEGHAHANGNESETEKHGGVHEIEDEESRREAGNEERTVVLCVEVENSGESGVGVGFRVESVEVCIGGEGARAFLVGWGDRRQPDQHRWRRSDVGVGKGDEDGEDMFPLEIGSKEQYNLLYAVSFLQNPDDTDGFSLGMGTGKEKEKGGSGQELQRAVTINIVGKPVVRPRTDETATEAIATGDGENTTKDLLPTSTSYPTQSFTSRWNCILDLSPQPHRPPDHSSNDHDQYQSNQTSKIKDAMPEPASPFPMSQSQSQQYQQYQNQQIHQSPHPSAPGTQGQQTAGSKRYTVPGAVGASIAARAIKHTGVGGMRASLTHVHQQQRERDSSSPKISYTPPSIAVQSHAGYLSSPTTYGPPPSAGGGGSNGGIPRSSFGFDSPALLDTPQSANGQHSAFPPPQTPAYPAYPSHASASPSPLSHVPVSSLQSGAVGSSVEIKRQRGFGAGAGSGAVMVQSPGPMVVGPDRGMAMAAAMQNVVDEEEGEPIVISVGLLSPPSQLHSGSTSTKIYPLDTFTLDIFVFNQSTWTRRFEISSPDQRRRRKQDGVDARFGTGKGGLLRGLGDGDKPGILPLENRIRIG
jgi:hypothetical protein